MARGLCSRHWRQWRKGQDFKGRKWENGLRKCFGCNEYLGPDVFGRDARSNDGLSRQCRSCLKSRHIKLYFNLSEESYAEMLAAQGGGCAICGMIPEDNGKRLAVDHDHRCCPTQNTCGKCVRSLLCDSCNVGLGKFRDSAELLRRASEYLEAR